MLAGLILAGGEGRRFGGPKAWAQLPDGRSFLEACVSALLEAGAVRVAATLPPESLAPEIPGLLALPLPETGLDMFASLRFGLEHLIQGDDWRSLAVLPVDHPLVAAGTVGALAAAAERAVIPSYRGKHGHPIVIAREVALSIIRGDLSGPTMREVLRAVGATDLEVDDPGVVANCNTPAALSAALARRGSF
ncbi:MAG: NTP transferase domain-containing protein [Acidobacteriota bacterium]|nr:NTP transferase domain-containing protein [Acidobacteriota bacterium]